MFKRIEKLSDSTNIIKSVDDKTNSKKFKNWFHFNWIHSKDSNPEAKRIPKKDLFNDYEKKILNKSPMKSAYNHSNFNIYQHNINYNFIVKFPSTDSIPSTYRGSCEPAEPRPEKPLPSPPSTPNTVFTEPNASTISSVTTPSEQTSRSSLELPNGSIYSDFTSATNKQKHLNQPKCRSNNDYYSRNQYRYLEIEIINKINRNRLILSNNLKFKQLNKLNKYKKALYNSINILNKKLKINKLNINTQLDLAVMNQEQSNYSSFISNCKIINVLLTYYDDLLIEKSNLLRKLNTVKIKIELLNF